MKYYIAILIAIFSIIFIVALSGCKPKPATVQITHTITNTDISDILFANGLCFVNPILVDEVYALPSTDWVKSTFANNFFNLLASLNSLTYVNTENDCDDFATVPLNLQKSKLIFLKYKQIFR